MTMINKMVGNIQKLNAVAGWQAGIAQAVFEPFYACMLCELQDGTKLAWYETFLKETQTAASETYRTGVYAPALNAYWTKAHLTLKNELEQRNLLTDNSLAKLLPLAVHMGFGVLQQLASAEGVSLREYVVNHFGEALAHLPAWADKVLDDTLLAKAHVDNLFLGALDDTVAEPMPDSPTTASDNSPLDTKADTLSPNLVKSPSVAPEQSPPEAQKEAQKEAQQVVVDKDTSPAPVATVVPRPVVVPKANRANTALLAGFGVSILVLLSALGFFLYKKYSATPDAVTAVSDTPTIVETGALPFLSITVGQTGELYACHAELASEAQSQALLQVLQVHFNNTLCVIDIDDTLVSDFVGFDKLKSIIGLLKSAPYATLQFSAGQAFINAPSSEDVTRLVADIGALMPNSTVLAMPAIDENQAISDSLQKASTALDALPDNASDYQLAKALSLQLLNTKSAQIPAVNEAVLKLSAQKIASRPNARFIIAVHSDDTGDVMGARMQTQEAANAIKSYLLANGVSETQLVPQGVGYDFPIADNKTSIGRFKNNRVEFLVYDDSIMQALTQLPNNPAPVATDAYSNAPTSAPTSAGATNYIVIDGRIVDANGPEAQAYAAEQEAARLAAEQAAAAPPPAPPSYQPPPPPPSTYYPPAPSASSAIPEDLLREVVSENNAPPSN